MARSSEKAVADPAAVESTPVETPVQEEEPATSAGPAKTEDEDVPALDIPDQFFNKE